MSAVEKKNPRQYCRGCEKLRALGVANRFDGEDDLHGRRGGCGARGPLESQLGNRNVSGVEHLRVVGGQSHDGVGRTVQLHLDVLVRRGRALVRQLDEGGKTAVRAQDVDEVRGERVRRQHGLGEYQRVVVFFGEVGVNTTVVRYDLNESLVERNLRVSETLPIVTVGKRLAVKQLTVNTVRAGNEHGSLNTRLHLLTQVSRRVVANGNRRGRGGVQVKLSLLRVVEFYLKN